MGLFLFPHACCSMAGGTFCRVFVPSAVLPGCHVPLEHLAVTEEVETVGAVGERDAVKAQGRVAANGPLDSGEGLFAIVVAEDERPGIRGGGRCR